jgi:sigma-70-like protein
MSALEDLPADQRAVLTLVLAKGRSYDEIASMLSIDRSAVRDRALAALEALGPASELSRRERAVLTDYLLGQVPDGDASEIRARLAQDGSDRVWAGRVAELLTPIAQQPLQAIPAPADDGPHLATARADQAAASPMARDRRPSSRRGGAILLVCAGLVLAAGITVAAIGALGGSSNSGGSATSGTGTAGSTGRTQPTATTHALSTPFSLAPPGSSPPATVQVLTRLALLPPHPAGGRREAGVAEVVRSAGRTGIVIVAQGLAPNTKRNAYAVWLSDPAGASAFLGFVSRLVTANGKLTAGGALPADAARYSRVLVTLETQGKPKVPGTVVLEGELALKR